MRPRCDSLGATLPALNVGLGGYHGESSDLLREGRMAELIDVNQ